MASPQERFGEQLRRLREAAGYSQEELAERAGLSANAISALERGERKRPYPGTLRRLADALQLGDGARAELAALLRGDAATPAPVAAMAASPAPATELPGEPTPFIGREREASVVRHLLLHAEGRLLTLVGPGGVGKTRLALHLARDVMDQYPDGVVWVELAPLGDPALVLPTIARAVGLDELPGGDPVTALRAWLRDRHLLLVLDNMEHLLEAAPGVARLLRECPSLAMLATSRSPLKIRGEQEYLVPPLELPPSGPVRDEAELAAVSSVQFFVWQARQKRDSFALTAGNAASVAEICRRLDGLPLALELVAARIRVLEPAEVLARLDNLMPLLVGGSRDLPQRQQTMRAAIAWSYELLEPAAQALFRRLAVFAGGWTLDAAAAITPADVGEAVDLLGDLVEQSLVTATQDDDGTRYGMLEPIRQFAFERLQERGEADDAGRCHAGYVLALAEQAAAGLEGRSGQVVWLDRLSRENDNLRAALAWCQDAPGGGETGLRLANALWRYWEMRWYVDEGSRWMAAALARSDGLSLAIRAKAFTVAGNLARDLGDHDQATIYQEQGLALWREVGDPVGVARALNNLGVIARDQGDAERTLRFCLESLALFREAGNRHGAAIAMISLGIAAGQLGDLAQSRAYFGESLDTFRASGDGWHAGWVLNYLAEIVVAHDEVDEARAAAREALDLHTAAHEAWGMASAHITLGKAARLEQALDVAAAHFAEGLRLLVGARVERAIPACLDELAMVLLAGNEPDRAALLAGASMALRAAVEPVDATIARPAGDPAFLALHTGSHAAWAEGRALDREQVFAVAQAVAAEFAQPGPGSTIPRAV